jgi:hypothetical protein
MLVTYIIGSLALIVKPGPDLTCTIATALAGGKAKAATLMLQVHQHARLTRGRAIRAHRQFLPAYRLALRRPPVRHM